MDECIKQIVSPCRIESDFESWETFELKTQTYWLENFYFWQDRLLWNGKMKTFDEFFLNLSNGKSFEFWRRL